MWIHLLYAGGAVATGGRFLGRCLSTEVHLCKMTKGMGDNVPGMCDFLKICRKRIFMQESLDKSGLSGIIRVYLITKREYYSPGGRIYE